MRFIFIPILLLSLVPAWAHPTKPTKSIPDDSRFTKVMLGNNLNEPMEIAVADSVVLLPLLPKTVSPSGIQFQTVGNVTVSDLGGRNSKKSRLRKTGVIFNGGALVGTWATEKPKTLSQFTLYLRVWIDTLTTGDVFRCGSDTAGIRVFTRMAGIDSQQQNWDNKQQNYLAYTGHTNRVRVLEAEIALDNVPANRKKMRVGVPCAMIGSARWHDVVLRFSGAKLDLFVDGALVDEEWPVGRVPTGSTLILGARPDNESAGFVGRMSAVQLWQQALSDERVTQLSGGKPQVVRRAAEILGPPQKSLQYFTPSGHNTWAGDVVSFYHEGVFHLFYLRDRRQHASKFGCGGHSFAHATSRDLRTWQHQPDAVPITASWETLGTGTVLFWQGTYYLFYGLHTDRVVAEARPAYRLRAESLQRTGQVGPIGMDTLGVAPMGATFATSKDGIHFTKSGVLIHPSQNPSVFVNETTNSFEMLAGYGSDGFYTSTDLLHWQKQASSLTPVGKNSPCWNAGECHCLFEWNGFNYVLAGRTGFFMSKDRAGAYQPALGFKPIGSSPVAQPRWDLYDGLWVPMVAPFKDNRRILAGWIETGGSWAGMLLFRELIQEPDGTLGMKWPDEMIPASGQPIRLQTENGRAAQSHTVEVEAGDFRYVELSGLRSNTRITMRIEPSPGAEAFGINLLGYTGYDKGAELQFTPARKQAQWGNSQQNKPSAPLITFSDIVNKGPYVSVSAMKPADNSDYEHIPFKGTTFAISGVEGLDKSFELDIIIKPVKNGAYVLDACIDGRRTMASWRPNLNGDRLALFVRQGKVRFTNITVKPLL